MINSLYQQSLIKLVLINDLLKSLWLGFTNKDLEGFSMLVKGSPVGSMSYLGKAGLPTLAAKEYLTVEETPGLKYYLFSCQ